MFAYIFQNEILMLRNFHAFGIDFFLLQLLIPDKNFFAKSLYIEVS